MQLPLPPAALCEIAYIAVIYIGTVGAFQLQPFLMPLLWSQLRIVVNYVLESVHHAAVGQEDYCVCKMLIDEFILFSPKNSPI